MQGACQEQVSDSTKWQIGHSQTENDGPRDHQGKALIKGCRERTRARGCVPSQEKVHVRNGFPTRLKSKEVEVEQEITGKVTVKVKLSSRAVVKEQGLGDMCLHKRRCTQIGT